MLTTGIDPDAKGTPMELVKESLVLIHLAGMAVLVGVFLTRMKKKSDYPFTAMMWAAIAAVCARPWPASRPGRTWWR
jgi:hypothetical protein